MNEPIESTYFNWLVAKVIQLKNPTPSLTFWRLLQELHQTEFVWLVPNDDNRVQDGLDLRPEFLRELSMDEDVLFDGLGCSVLEMLIAFARRIEFDTDEPLSDLFWGFVENMGLKRFNDASYDVRVVVDILTIFIWRTYNFSGAGGGMFPLHKPKRDQRKVEIWYQYCDYVIDLEDHERTVESSRPRR